MENIWKKLTQTKEPIFILAPMEDVTDSAFRQVIIGCGRPNLFYTEFTNVEGINSEGVLKVIHRLKYQQIEKPIIAQVWGITPDDYYKACKVIVDLGFDGVDINMGCPVKNVIKQGACSALIKNYPLAKEIVNACRKGLNGKIPLSIKTRIGFNNIETDTWIKFVLEELTPDALIVHGRTVKEESKVPNHWEEIGKCVKLNNQIQLKKIEKLKNLTQEEKIDLICKMLIN